MKTLLQIYSYMLRHYWYLIGGIVGMLGYALFSGITITAIIPIFDYVFKTHKTVILYHDFSSFVIAVNSAIHAFFTTHHDYFNTGQYSLLWDEVKKIMMLTDSYMLLLWVCEFVFCVFIIKNIFLYLNKYMFFNLRGRTLRDVRNLLYEKYLYQSMSYLNANQVGDSLVRMINDMDIVNNELLDRVFNIARDVLTIITFAVIAISLNPKLFFISAIVFPVFTVLIEYIGRKIRKYARRIQTQFSSMFSRIEEVLHNMRIVKAFAKEDYELNQFKAINNKYFKLWNRSQQYMALGVPIGELNTALIGLVVLLLGGNAILTNNSDFTFGDFTAFLFAVFSMLHPLKVVASSITDIRKAFVSLDRVAEILDQDTNLINNDNAILKDSFDNIIEYKKVGFHYIDNQEILKDIDLTIKKGESIALIGPSGSGKTTMVNLLNRMFDVTSGCVCIDGVDIRGIDIYCLRRLFGTVTQDSILFSDTIFKNIAYGAQQDMSIEEIKNACKIAYADEFIEQLANGYDTVIQPRGSNFSGGQKQRICIARAIINNPPILIFDEATSALDTDSEKRVQDAIDRATKDRTVIIIAHRLSTILKSDKIIVMDKGKIVGIGKHEDLIKTCAMYQHLYNIQFAQQLNILEEGHS